MAEQKKPINLHEAIGQTEPGQRAHALGRIHYDYSHQLPKQINIQLQEVRGYLEGLAKEEIRRQMYGQIPKWQIDLIEEGVRWGWTQKDGQRLRSMREAAGATMRDVSTEANVKVERMSAIEMGRVEPEPHELLDMIAALTALEPDT